jgi:integrase
MRKQRSHLATVKAPWAPGIMQFYCCWADWGLRAGEIAALKLDDIDWDSGSLYVHGKSARECPMPLPADVGEAIADYLQKGRPHSTSRSYFCVELRWRGSLRDRKPSDLSLSTRWNEQVLIRRTRVPISFDIDWPAIYCARVLPWQRLASCCAIVIQKQGRSM